MMSESASMKIILSLLAMILGLFGHPGPAGDDANAVPAGQPGSGEPGKGQAEREILAANAAFVKAYNDGDARAVAALFTEDAESTDEDGTRLVGRRAIEESFAETFAASPGGKIQIRTDSLRFLSPDVAKEEGRSTVTLAGGAEPDVDRYTVIYVKQDGKWLQSTVREHPELDLSPHERLEELSWMIGEWVDESDAAVIHTTCRWSDDGNFLLRVYSIKVRGRDAISGTQRIGWDPVAGQFRSWNFDSQGGYSEGLWARDGDRWIVKMAGPLRSGKIATETNIITHDGKNAARWRSVDRTIAGKVLPDSPEFVPVRTPPQPKN
jgi:uncharacterized protein (TIGR02246 family)